VVVVINDPAATRRIVNLARSLNPQAYIVVRTRYLQELQSLFDLGADDVVPEEFETSVEIFTLVLRKYLVAKEEIERFVTQVRADGYLVLRGISGSWTPGSDICMISRSAPSAWVSRLPWPASLWPKSSCVRNMG
jgi:CPA2 family monovalent cation:H+ antiporter-2